GLFLPDGVPRRLQIVETLPLVEDGRLGRIQVLRLSLSQDPAAECHHPAPLVVNREDEPASEPYAGAAVIPLDREPSPEQCIVGNAEAPHLLQEGLSARGKAESQPEGGLQRDIAARQVRPGRFRLVERLQLRREPVVRSRGRRVQRLVRVGAGLGGPLRNDDPRAPRNIPHRRRVVHPESLHEVGEDVARFMADVTVEETFLGNDGEIPVLAAVERAGSAPVGTGAPELDRLTDDAEDVRALAHLLDDLVGDHQSSSTMVTPVPPWLRGANANERIRRSLETTRRTRSRTTPVPMP